jgi:hypothetical protein
MKLSKWCVMWYMLTTSFCLMNAQEHKKGLDRKAVPSLVLLGTAKGGTTDLWHIIHKLKIGFDQYENGQTNRIQTRKELDFFGGTFCVSDTTSAVCPVSHMETLLRCPNSILSEYSLEGLHMVRVCQEWLDKRQMGV